MRITNKELQNTTKMLDDIIEVYKKETTEKKRDWRTYEQRVAQRIKTAIKELEPLIEEAVSSINIIKAENRGRKQELTLKQKAMLLLLKHLIAKSNREMSIMLVLFSLLSGIDVSYKYVERLYSDEEVLMALHNMHMLLLKKKGVKDADCSGDGTGYALTIKKHYATEAEKRKDKAKNSKNTEISTKLGKKKKQFVYSFKLMDLETRMYIGYGTSLKSEKGAFLKAVAMAKLTDIDIDSVRLDKYYSAQSYAKFFNEEFGDIDLYLIPKKNATVKGSFEWKSMLYLFVNSTTEYLYEYYKRNHSEDGFSEDKRRFGWKFCTTLWHNLFWLG